MTDDVDRRYPLAWPHGYPRTRLFDRKDGSSVFGRSWTPERARRELKHEVYMLGGQRIILSTNVKLRQDGEPYARQPAGLQDTGVAIYFRIRGANARFRDVSMACDLYTQIWANTRALALCIESLRRLERHGGGEILDRAFTGFAALPASITPAVPWWTVLGWDGHDGEYDADDVEAAFRDRAKVVHPDREGGSEEAFAELQKARDEALRRLS